MNGALKELRELALTHSRTKHPSLPESARYVKPYSDKTANDLQRAITDFLNLAGHQCERIAVTGRYIDQSKIIKDTLGFSRKIGSGKWIRSSMQKGSADLSAIVKNKEGIGVSVKIEIKIGRDKMNDFQKQYQSGVERAGGLYWLVTSFDHFLKYYNELI
jgi:hypothetical protein